MAFRKRRFQAILNDLIVFVFYPNHLKSEEAVLVQIKPVASHHFPQILMQILPLVEWNYDHK